MSKRHARPTTTLAARTTASTACATSSGASRAAAPAARLTRPRCFPLRPACAAIACAIAAAALLAIAPAAFAGTVTKDVSNGDAVCDDASTSYVIVGSTSDHSVRIKGGTAENPIQVELDGVSIDRSGDSDTAIEVESGYAVITISGTNRLVGGNKSGVGKNSGYAGLNVRPDATLILDGDGTLYAQGGGDEYGGAGIGGNYNDDVKSITIQGSPSITAVGAYSAPGIGAGRDGELYDLTINGGTVNATGGKYAPGLGAGDAVGSGSGGTGHTITINGGTVTAQGGYKAAGIGGSEGGSIENISITGGTVNATGGEYGAGIGSGSGATAGNISITGGAITAQGGTKGAGIGGADGGKATVNINQTGSLFITAQGGDHGAGIGGGSGDAGSTTIRLSGATINATGGEGGAGIGSGGDAGDISLYGTGTIKATGGYSACGIGGGETSTCGTITVKGDSGRALTITAIVPTKTNWNAAAAIGSGRAECGNISLSNAKITAKADYGGAGIGTGAYNLTMTGGVDTIAIDDCEIACEGSNKTCAGIGSGFGGNVKHISLANSTYTGAGIGSSSCCSNGLASILNTQNTIESIDISASTVTATTPAVTDSGERVPWAGIGSGPWGTVKSITIENGSNVTATGSNGGAGIGSGGWYTTDEIQDYRGGDVDAISISNSTVSAHASNGGAGIGGGFDTSVGTIDITGSQVTADASGGNDGGAGIGGGRAASAEDITISASTVTAQGGNLCPGIGGGGASDFVTTFFWSHVKKIVIENGSDVTATGGANGAGIGAGQGCWISGDSDKGIIVSDSTIVAQGGENGAGIGGGSNATLGRGGDLDRFTATGACKITATGGDKGAGIGGGEDGAASNITLALTTTENRDYYVKATGGAGAAGIGSGSVASATSQAGLTTTGHDAKNITISGGYIVAHGGWAPAGYSGSSGVGSGAGIGGGSHYGKLEGLTITGGYIEASQGGGSSDDAMDIGHGGNGTVSGKPLSGDSDFTVTGGTIIAAHWSDRTTPTITGGSVSARIDGVKNGKTPVYQTTLTLPDQAYAQIDKLTTSIAYGTTDLFTDGNDKLYLYLPASADKAQWADVQTGGSLKHYYGTTTTDGTGVLKMDGSLAFKNLTDALTVGGTATLELIDGLYTGQTFDFTVTSGATVAAISGATSSTAPNASVTLSGLDFGTYQITAVSETGSDAYWPPTATFTGTIEKAEGSISIDENPSKTYDGTAVDDPAVTKNGDGAVTYTYYDSAGNALTSAPTEAGTYSVTATMAATSRYSKATSEPLTFTIAKKVVTLGLSASQASGTATVTASVLGMVDKEGSISFSITGPSGDAKKDVAVSDDFTATTTYDYGSVSTGSYTVSVSLVNAKNYSSDDASQTYDVARETRSITGVEASYVKTYGDAAFKLSPKASVEGSKDSWTYTVVNDQYPNLANAVDVDKDGTVSINNAGRTVIKVTLVDGNNHYADAVAYTTVNVKRATLTVTPYAYTTDSATHVTSVQYGQVSTLNYGLEYSGFTKPSGATDLDTASTFTKGHGTLEPVSLVKTLAASDTPYQLEVKKVGASPTVGGTTYDNVFLSRNYAITYGTATMTVTKAPLAITANDATGTWGTEPAYTYRFGDSNTLMSWDSAASVFDTLPVASLDTATAGGDYASLKPGIYTEAVAVSAGTLNAAASYETPTTTAGTLTVNRAASTVGVQATSKPYDGTAATVSTSAADNYDGTVSLAYYRMPDSGIIPDTPAASDKLVSAPTDVGDYYVVATAPATDYFAKSTATCAYSITVAPSAVAVSADSKAYDGTIATVTTSTAQGYDGTVSLAYYQVSSTDDTNDGTLLPSAPTDVGNYYVVATAPASERFSASTAKTSFDIEKIRSTPKAAVSDKTYDGKPASVTTSAASGYDGTISVSYYRALGPTSSTAFEKLDSAPTDAGSYYAVAKATATDHYYAGVGISAFTIAQATPDPVTPTLPDLTLRSGLTLADEPLPAGWSWVDSSQAITATGTVTAKAIYTPDDTTNYTIVERTLTFRVVSGTSPSNNNGGGDNEDNDQGDGVSADNGTSAESTASTGDMPLQVVPILAMLCALAAAGAVAARRREK